MSKRNKRTPVVNARGKPRMMTKDDKPGFCAFWAERMYEVLRQKGDLTDEEKTYLMDKLESMKDEKLKSIIVGLIGWGDEERGEVETFVAIGIELFKSATLSNIREAVRVVELRSLVAGLPIPESLTISQNCEVVDDPEVFDLEG